MKRRIFFENGAGFMVLGRAAQAEFNAPSQRNPFVFQSVRDPRLLKDDPTTQVIWLLVASVIEKTSLRIFGYDRKGCR
jgi:hypothetical protein